ncbi:hypothetical protein GX51_02150 [Blastomyces parvus]|uniref:Aminoglycoside phosphotransferase domain-containing protein n=1 Tax=Blastomyces parvus TaxID=2060905 RepID=A0A2B7XD83_9EURO|nr:hypothetical protein GX51_02150 [Blastomyces parvus]
MPEQYLMKDRAVENNSPANPEKSRWKMSMDCLSYVFYPGDLYPGNITTENGPNTMNIGIVDW